MYSICVMISKSQYFAFHKVGWYESCIKKRKTKEATADACTRNAPVDAIAAFHSEVKLGPCTSVLRIVLHYIIINSGYIASLYTIFRKAHQGTFITIINVKCAGTRP